ncbi:hypothetical protein ASPWEDRAFT_170563 [Aspergillus wentii DTO 134E9]|uniref:LITAF domain-containing protein n=1 Tax=Aspergillus wentii DTO 134E9 TaxID=1073089 RepID=A0A1L9RQA5_ASPWE|nr:uncharacterized protein ASPWEDRAFT_170563 [Aspergillus wentii DTO 134E9]KAI9928439.1 hypothetical protein MW887_002484 [Aspergillus wentii]OJJ37072.1 hypothetical protein ASPWEDRAFT_170563 [Aspergillus wentii DTO 134E9]
MAEKAEYNPPLYEPPQGMQPQMQHQHQGMQPIEPDHAYIHEAPTPVVQPDASPIPMQTMQAVPTNPNGYQSVTPLHALNRASTPVDCPVCGKREMTKVEARNGNTNHGWAALLCCCFCLGCIPYLMSSLKDVEHRCGNCNAHLATWHNSGHVDIHQGGQKK